MAGEPGTSPDNPRLVKLDSYYQVSKGHPVGLPEELEELGLSTHDWASCAKPERGSDGMQGCKAWNLCPWRGKGPKYVGVRIARKGSPVVNVVRTCFDYMKYDFHRRMLPNEARRVVKHEGDSMVSKRTVPVSPSLTGNNPDKRMRVEWCAEVIPVFPRPKESLVDFVGAEQVYADLEAATEAEVQQTYEPIPKRRGTPGGSPAEKASQG